MQIILKRHISATETDLQTYQVNPSDTLLVLQNQFTERTGLNYYVFRFIYHGVILFDSEKTFQELTICSDSVIHVTKKTTLGR
jgi:hypothetical protein